MDLHRTSSKIFKFAFFLGFLAVIDAQVSVPARQDGFYYKSRPATADTILIETFLDPVCPDSRDAWQPLKQAVDHYGHRVTLVVHTFPLPYHDNAFVTSRALHIIDTLNTTATFDLLEAFFNEQEKFSGTATFNVTRAIAIDQVVKFATKSVGDLYGSAIKSGFANSKTDRATRNSFKAGCLRGVYGTPFFFVNGFPLPDAGSAIDYKGWRRILDPLVNEQGIIEEPLYFTL